MSNFEENGAGKNTMFTNIKTRDFTVKERHESSNQKYSVIIEQEK